MLLGREKEVDLLKKNLSLAKEGTGRFVLVKGEAGIGKTTLVEEFLKREDCTVIRGRCSPILTPPLHPIKEALSEVGLGHLLGMPVNPRVMILYLVHESGILMAKAEREEFSVDPDIFTSMLTAVSMFVKDSFGDMGKRDEYLEELRYGKYNLVMKKGVKTTLVAILEGRSNEFLHGDMEGLLTKIEENYKSILERWDGNTDSVKDIEILLYKFLRSGKYDGQPIDGIKDWSFENVRLGLGRLSEKRVVCVFIDDIQWADETTVSLLHYLARSNEDRIMITATYRSEEINNVILELEEAIIREGIGEIIDLGPLDMDNTLKVIEEITGFEVGMDVLNYIYDVSEGIPLNIIEVTRYLTEEGLFHKEGEKYTLKKTPTELPEKMNSIIKRRVRNLDEDSREIIEIAAVLGTWINIDLLSCATGIKKIRIIKSLRKMAKTGLISRKSSGFSFYHDYIRDAIYLSIDRETLKEYHSIIAECLEKSSFPADLKETIMAEHYYNAGLWIKAIEFSKKALDIAVRDGAWGEAMHFAKICYECANKIDDEKTMAEMCVKIGDIHYTRGEYERAAEWYRKSLKIRDIYIAHIKLGNSLLNMGSYENAKKEFRKAEVLCDDPREVLIHHANVNIRTGEFSKAESELMEYIEWAKDDPKKLVNAYKTLSILYSTESKLDKAMKYLQKALSTAKALGMKKETADIMHNMGVVHYLTGNNSQALEKVLQVMEIRESIGDMDGYLKAANLLGLIYWSIGNAHESEKYFKIAGKYARLMGRRDAYATALADIGMIKYYLKKSEESTEYLKKALEIFREIDNAMGKMESLLYMISALLDTEYSKNREIRDLLQEAESLANRLGIENYVIWCKIISLRISNDLDSLKNLASTQSDPLIKGIAYLHLWRETGKDEYRIKGIKYFKKANFIGATNYFIS